MDDVLPGLFGRLMKLYERLENAGRVDKDSGEHGNSKKELSAPVHEAIPYAGDSLFYYLPLEDKTGEMFGVCLPNSNGQVNVYPSSELADTDVRYQEFIPGIESFLIANGA